MVRLAVAVLGHRPVVRGGVFRAVAVARRFGRAPTSCRCFRPSPSSSRWSRRPRRSGRCAMSASFATTSCCSPARSTWRCRDVAARTDKETATISEMSGAVGREIERLSERIATTRRHRRRRPAAQVPTMSCRIRRRAGRASRRPLPEAATPAPEHGAIEAAYRKAVAAGEFDISLQPIVSVSRSAATGFEVFANLPVEGGERVDLRRLAQALPGRRSGGVRAHPGRRRRCRPAASGLAPRARQCRCMSRFPTPSSADAKELAPLLDMLQFYPDLAQVDRAVGPERPLRCGGDACAGAGPAVGKGRPLRRAKAGTNAGNAGIDRRSKASTSSRSRPTACSTATGNAASSCRRRRSSKARTADDVTIIAVRRGERRGCRQPDRSRRRPDGRAALRRPEAAEARRRQPARPPRAALTGRERVAAARHLTPIQDLRRRPDG